VFWWNKVRTYDVKNAESRHVWWTSDFSERRVIWEIFGCEGAAGDVEDVSVEDGLGFLWGLEILDLMARVFLGYLSRSRLN